MQSTSVVASPNSYYPIPSHLLLHSHSPFRTRTILSFDNTAHNVSSASIHTSHNRTHKHRRRNTQFNESTLFHQFDPPINTNTIKNQNPDHKESREYDHQLTDSKTKEGLSTNMRWADLKAAVGQRINVEGIVYSAKVFVKERHLTLPHVTVPDIRYIDWGELKKRGFKGVVFDKDNTITAPYSLSLWPLIESSVGRCKTTFGNDIAVFSNSAGLLEYDHDGSKAQALEGTVQIKVIRHKSKKPAGTAEEIEEHFGCASSELIMVGDRPFTDIVYGNRNNFLTILTAPLSLKEEPFIVRQVRKIELALVNHWFRRGLTPVRHVLLQDPMDCVLNPPPP